MKKLFTFSVAVLFAACLMAQQVSTDDGSFRFEGSSPVDTKTLMQRFQSKPDKDLAVGWMIPSWNLLDYYWLNTMDVTHFANLIFPDSTVQYESGGNIIHNWMNSVGGTFEPYSEIFDSNGSFLINPGAPYRIDSIFVLGWYNVVSSGVADTLILEIEQGVPHTAPEFAWTVYNFPDDTLNLSPAKVLGSADQTGYKCKMTAASKTVIKYPLTMNDSTLMYGKYIIIPVNYNVTADNIVGLSLTFVPGQLYSFGDMLFSYSGTQSPVLNSFRVGLYATDNTTQDPHVFDDPFYHWNSHHYIRKEVRYSMYTGTNAWRNERMTSTVSWGFDIGYFVTNTTPGIGMPEAGMDQVQISPNPTQGPVMLENISANTRIKVTDVQGQLVIDQVIAGTSEKLDLSTMKNGIYFITLVGENESATYKVIVQH